MLMMVQQGACPPQVPLSARTGRCSAPERLYSSNSPRYARRSLRHAAALAVSNSSNVGKRTDPD